MPDVPAADYKFPIRNGILQGNLDCAGHTLINLDLSGLGLTKASVGLDQVDNTSDADKPISDATKAALDLKEDLIAAGTTGQFWNGEKTWLDHGSFIFQNNQTTYSLLTVRGDDASLTASLRANRNDTALVNTQIAQYGASVAGSIAGIPAANIGLLGFIGVSYGLIMTSAAAPLVFGVNGIRRMRLTQGLNVGGDADPGAGCITASGTITAANFVGPIGAGSATSLQITGVGGAGYIAFAPQTTDPPGGLGALVFANTAGRIAIQGGLNVNHFSLNTDALTADRIWGILNIAGDVPIRVTALPGSSAATGVSGSIAFDASFLYLCVAANTWRRVALAAF